MVLDSQRHGGPFGGNFLRQEGKVVLDSHRHGGPFCGNFLDKRVKWSWILTDMVGLFVGIS